MDVPVGPLLVSPSPAPAVPIPQRDPEDPSWRSVELAQRGRIILDVARTDLDEAERRLGSFHETTWHFRQALDEARRFWERLRAEVGTRSLEAALAEPPVAVLPLMRGQGPEAVVAARLILVGGKTYCVENVPGTPWAPVQLRLTRLPPEDESHYYVCRLRDRSTQCDCAEWVYRVADNPEARPCKHLAALEILGWL